MEDKKKDKKGDKSEDMKDPEVLNPLHKLMLGDMPGLPQIIQNAMPVELPRANFQQDSFSLFFDNVKRGQLVKATEREAKIAENSYRSIRAKLDTIKAVVTFSSEIKESFEEFEHRKTLRVYELQEREADVFIKRAQAQQMGFDAKSAEADWEMREIQLK